MNRPLLVALLASVTGCAMTIPYRPPTDGPIATIHFSNASSVGLAIAYYEVSERCQRRRTAAPIPSHAMAAHLVPAGGELTFQLHVERTADRRYCLVNLRFTPRDGAQYEFRTESSILECRWRMTDATDPARPVPVKLRQVTWSRGATEDGSWCSE